MAPKSRSVIRLRGIALVLATLCAHAACDGARANDAEHAQNANDAMNAQTAASAPSIPADAPAGFAAVLRMAGDSGGVRVALDSLTALVARDRALGPQGHHLAHELGRFAQAERGDLSVLEECTPVFQSGCYHGALEGYFLEGARVDSASVRAVCPQRPRPGQPGYAVLECWHGLGHGLMVQAAGDVRQALPLCDALESAGWRRECQDGVFMERTLRAMAPAVSVAHGAAGGHASGGHAHGGGAAASAEPLSNEQLARQCDGVDARYQPSCWLYQPSPLVRIHGLDAAAVLRACDRAPAGAVDDCYRGFGKVYMGASSQDMRGTVRACGRGDGAHATDCLLGGVEFLTDLEWTAEPGIAFCARVPADAKAACYGLVGARLALIHPTAEGAASACARVERGMTPACLAGVRRGGS
jgi:hypothetical protein